MLLTSATRKMDLSFGEGSERSRFLLPWGQVSFAMGTEVVVRSLVWTL